MFGRLFIIFAVLPILEIMLLISVSDNIGGWNTFAVVIITAFFGAYFVRKEGASALRNVQTKIAQGQVPGKELSEGLLLLVAGVLLVTPGFITDIIGLLFTMPITRAPIAAYIVKSLVASGKVQGNFSFHQQGGFDHSQGEPRSPFGQRDSQNGDVFDAEYEDKTASEDDSESKNRLN
ncbi:FxsA family protein [Glaciecola sp. MH2013]|uniref:FxsA family protein n=1 Tax=Glaciecola sp. MH2013 TaxID=2785524 RepID=UPI00189E660E|nr:FxsA family protein [Glaciecola sp. MH2013]MBF7074318.1 FxsA family protein [Glaciecola sp. MH2013]